jgi:hypothetical protein
MMPEQKNNASASKFPPSSLPEKAGEMRLAQSGCLLYVASTFAGPPPCLNFSIH